MATQWPLMHPRQEVQEVVLGPLVPVVLVKGGSGPWGQASLLSCCWVR